MSRTGLSRVRAAHARSGMTIIEMSSAAGILAIVLLGSLAMARRDNDLANTTLGISVSEMKAQQMIRKLESELAEARGVRPVTTLTNALGASGTASMEVASTRGFPPFGTLLVNRGTGTEERLDYAGLAADGLSFETLLRGQQCTDPFTHADGAEVLWGGLAEPLALQVNPPAAQWDGIAGEPVGNRFFRGDGTGFCYQIPTDPTGNGNFINGATLRWGATVADVPLADGFHAIVFVPAFAFSEADTGDDINKDGDRLDTFDVGQLRRLGWDATNPGGAVDDLGLGPRNILQERCNWGGDLDGDGLDDPMFLWDETTRRLHVRLFVIGRTRADSPIVRRVESMVFLRNEFSN